MEQEHVEKNIVSLVPYYTKRASVINKNINEEQENSYFMASLSFPFLGIKAYQLNS